MKHDPEVETVEVEIEFTTGHVKHDLGDARFPVVRGICQRCCYSSWEHGHSKESTELMLDHLRRSCPQGGRFLYVPSRPTKQRGEAPRT